MWIASSTTPTHRAETTYVWGVPALARTCVASSQRPILAVVRLVHRTNRHRRYIQMSATLAPSKKLKQKKATPKPRLFLCHKWLVCKSYLVVVDLAAGAFFTAAVFTGAAGVGFCTSASSFAAASRPPKPNANANATAAPMASAPKA